QGGYAREDLPLQQFQGGPAPCGDMGYFVGQPQGIEGRDGVSTADDAQGTRGSHRLGNPLGALGKGRYLKDPHGPIPYDGSRTLDRGGKGLDGLGADVHGSPAGRDLL